MFYRYEVLNDDGEWVGIFSVMNPDMRRHWTRILYEPKWYETHEDVESRCWFTEKGFQKYKKHMEETIEDLLWWGGYTKKEIRLITAEKLNSIAMMGKVQCIEYI